MNTPATPSQDIFDVRKIRRLVELMKEHDLCEIDLHQGEVRIQLRRASSAGQPVVGMTPAVQMPLPSPAAVSVPAADAKLSAAEVEEKNFVLVKSPMVGTFYAASDPNTPPFVKVGDHIGPETTVCIVEAMKVFNQIPAEASGRVIAVLAENGAPVEFGQPLFKLDPRE
jgi:acetyl-CoA carboxylase biotin carboxyl carrier protein